MRKTNNNFENFSRVNMGSETETMTVMETTNGTRREKVYVNEGFARNDTVPLKAWVIPQGVPRVIPQGIPQKKYKNLGNNQIEKIGGIWILIPISILISIPTPILILIPIPISILILVR